MTEIRHCYTTNSGSFSDSSTVAALTVTPTDNTIGTGNLSSDPIRDGFTFLSWNMEQDGAGGEIKPSSGGREEVEPPAPPVTTHSENSVVPNGPVSYIELDKNGTPLGEWHWDGDKWIFEEFPPFGNLPETGDNTGFPMRFVLLLGCFFLIMGATLYLLRMKKLPTAGRVRKENVC